MNRWSKFINRNTIFLAVAAILLVFYDLLVLLVFAIAVGLVFLYGRWRDQHLKEEEKSLPSDTFGSLEEAVAVLGDPDESITTDATRANELPGAMLVYRKLGLLVVAGEKVYLADIADVNVANRATPYTVGQHQIVFALRRKDNPYVRIDVGYDAEYARIVAEEVMNAINGTSQKSSQVNPTEESSPDSDNPDGSVISE